MSNRGIEILNEALTLPPDERAEIAERLLLSLDSERQRLDALWAIEVEDRLDAYDRGEIETIPAERVFDEIRSKIK
jgi:putative addiction module component (TIGR02574 family)